MDPITTLKTLVIKQLFKEAFQGLKEYLKKKNIKLLRNEKYLEESVIDHIKLINNW